MAHRQHIQDTTHQHKLFLFPFLSIPLPPHAHMNTELPGWVSVCGLSLEFDTNVALEEDRDSKHRPVSEQHNYDYLRLIER